VFATAIDTDKKSDLVFFSRKGPNWLGACCKQIVIDRFRKTFDVNKSFKRKQLEFAAISKHTFEEGREKTTMVQTFSLEEVAQHNSESDCWIM